MTRILKFEVILESAVQFYIVLSFHAKCTDTAMKFNGKEFFFQIEEARMA
jgi:hypothetical protein